MDKPTLLPDPTCLHLRLLDASTTTITAIVTTTSQEAECPLCHRPSTRIHSRYVRIDGSLSVLIGPFSTSVPESAVNESVYLRQPLVGIPLR
jgi:hypothetical protein